ncbi:MAG: PAS domain-containing protein [Alphaproteobacteria bacterium]|nr:PAS domain-containing protein [Alphaproteobacteria bacterium]
MKKDDLPTLIQTTAARVRARDYIWSLTISAGVLLAVEFSGLTLTPWLAPAAWIAFVVSLYVRYRFSSGRTWAEPVQRVIEAEMRSQAAEIESLQLARGLSQALPEPLFVLDPAGLIEFANPAGEEFVSASELEDRHFTSILRAPTVYEAVQEIANGANARIVDFTLASGVERHCRAFVAPLGDRREGGEGPERILVYVRDLTGEKRVEQMRVDFIASASHELRTPLASLLGFIETLRGHAREDTQAQERFLSIMQAQAERMQRLVSDLMSLSRIELNEHVRPREQVDLCALALELIESLEPVYSASSASVEFVCDEGCAVIVEGDRDQLLQAIQNLIDNAVKYGGDPARVEVRVGVGQAPQLKATKPGVEVFRVGDAAQEFAARNRTSTENAAFFQVRDFGKGVPRAALPRLTERFYRVNIEDSKRAGGTGLGLAIVKHIINRHKGGLMIESAAGEGTAFTCYLLRSSNDAPKSRDPRLKTTNPPGASPTTLAH